MQIDMKDLPDGKHKKMEKYVLRKAFDDPSDPYLPESVLWRQKEQFSDGVGYSWVDGLKEYAQQVQSLSPFSWKQYTPVSACVSLLVSKSFHSAVWNHPLSDIATTHCSQSDFLQKADASATIYVCLNAYRFLCKLLSLHRTTCRVFCCVSQV